MTRDQLAGKYLRLCAELHAVESGPTAAEAVIRRLVTDLAETWEGLKRYGATQPPLCQSQAGLAPPQNRPRAAAPQRREHALG